MLLLMWLTLFLFHFGVANRIKAYSTVPDLNRVVELRNKLLKLEQKLWKDVHNPKWCEVITTNSRGPDVCTANVFHEFNNEIKSYEKNMTSVISPVYKEWIWYNLKTELTEINKKYEKFSSFIKNQITRRYSSLHEDWIDLSKSIVHISNGSITTLLDLMYDYVIKGQFFKEVLPESRNQLCWLQESQQQLLTNTYLSLYEILILTQTKGYAMKQFSWMILHLHKKDDYKYAIENARTKYEEQSKAMVNAYNVKVVGSSRAIWRCDPETHIEDTTYIQITKLLQGYIENEVDMNYEGTCRENCAYYTSTRNHGCFKQLFCSRQTPCQGKIVSCRFIDSDMTICLASKMSKRRYEWIQYENGDIYGKKGSCSRGTSEVNSWWRWLFWHCSYCLCICDEAGHNSDRYFSLGEVKSDVRMNKVITGLRFKKVNRIIHLQISEAVMLPGGLIDEKTNAWREVVAKDLEKNRINVDYHQLSNDEKGIDLDDLEGAEGHVLTGVRFTKTHGRLNFEIRTTAFNYFTGKLALVNTWISNKNNKRTRLLLEKADISTLSPKKSEIDSGSNEYVIFGHTDFTADFAQTTIPFIDIQPVVPSILVPLTGAGIYHKGQKKYGGFVGLKIFTFDYSIIHKNTHFL